MVVAVRVSPPVKGKVPKLNMLELVSVANNRYKISKLRRRPLPEGYCYVCSRIDPNGIFRKQNGHLYKKGFLHTCEHFPKAPYTTFVQEEIRIQDDDGGESLADFVIDKTETISVTIRRGSRSTEFPSPLRTEDKFEPSLRQFAKDQQSSEESVLKDKTSHTSPRKFRLPQLAYDEEGNSSARSEVNRSTARKLNVLRRTSGAQKLFSRKSILKTESCYTGSEPNTVRDLIINPLVSNQTSARSNCAEGSSKSARPFDLDSMFVSSGRSVVDKPSATSTNSRFKLPVTQELFINKSDGLENAFSTEPLIREVLMIGEHREHRDAARRLKARLQVERKLHERHALSEHSSSTHRPGSGHLRYHHRVTEDSVPDPGFEIPPTPSEEVQDIEKLKLEHENGLNKGGPKDITRDSVSDAAEESDSEKLDRQKEISGILSEWRTFCRCATDMREISFTQNVCKTCGKDCKLRNSSSRGSSQNYSQGVKSKEGSFVSRSGRFMPTKMSEQDEIRTYKMNARNKPARNIDFLGQDTTIHEDEDRYWSSDEEFADFEQSPVSWLRNSKPYPLSNPDIHKQAYLEALQAAHMKGKKNIEDFEIDEFKMLRRPNVFSYIPLLPYEDKQKMKYIGIRPDDSSKPKKGQYMKHIFGDVRLEDFYPSVKASKAGKLIIDDLGKLSSTDQTNSKNSQVPATSRGAERSSVSLKMRSQGINFDNED